ncbi:hypothetical protein SAMN02745165_03416 [Malonomonas rubra DSM 5091]|uniref:Uncharacterized protein n=1 Tax=Malonomonas rubra DSM 5091 TaxID=1122189 RepID=A0A1M6MV14_MALRU|nr:hypothetical protein [Malonomonas rubra]SHJ87348.1 hypothetical protein SAMN02745165_03416 [Malonomonas rubra DSM 5091]
MKYALMTLTATLLAASPVLAADTTKTYTSGILVLLFVGFCAVLVVMQLLPAVMNLVGLTKQAMKDSRSEKLAQVKE